jgi:hypothetical protein
MNLYVGGCSFTYGHETKDNEATIKSHRPRWTWNDHLSNHFDGQLVNAALPVELRAINYVLQVTAGRRGLNLGKPLLYGFYV